MRMVRIGLHKVQENTLAHWIAVLIAAQPGLDPETVQSAGGAKALEFVQEIEGGARAEHGRRGHGHRALGNLPRHDRRVQSAEADDLRTSLLGRAA